MIRWRFVLTRLIVVVAVLVLLRWGLGPVANYVTVSGLQNATGAKVQIGQTRVGLFPPSIQYSDVQIADPRDDKEMRDAFRADSIELAIDGNALLHRRWVAQSGRITGLQIGARRAVSGHLDDTDAVDSHERSSDPSLISRLLGAASDELEAQSKQFADELETVKQSRAIRARWEKEYEALVSRARNLEEQIRGVLDQAKGIENPLRDWPEFERTLARARQARAELSSVHEEIDALPHRMQADLVRLEQAKQADLEKVNRYVPGDLSDPSQFSVDVMAGAIRKQIQQVRGYLDGGRTLANYTVVAPENVRSRGVYHDLDRIDRPEVMVRHCEVGGLMRAEGNVYALTGIVENLSPTPELLTEPTRARLRLEGPEVVRVEFIRDRRGTNDVDLLTLHWPEMEAKPMRLGDDDKAGLEVSGGIRELWVQLRMQGKKIDGRLVSKQTGVQMGLNIDPKFADTAAATSLSQSLSAVDQIEIDATFAGTWSDLDLQVKTNVGQILNRASRDAVDQQIRASKQMLAAKVDKAYADETMALQRWLGNQQSEARSLLANADKSIEAMSQKVLDEVGDADAYLGKLRSAIRGRLR